MCPKAADGKKSEPLKHGEIKETCAKNLQEAELVTVRSI